MEQKSKRLKVESESETKEEVVDTSERIAILDAGAQYGKVIDRRVRELSVHSELVPLQTPAKDLARFKAIIISGGPQSVFGKDAPKYDPDMLKLDVPILGICYGLQLLNFVGGGGVEKGAIREDGQDEIEIDTSSPLFADVPKNTKALLTHGDSVSMLADDYKVIGTSSSGIIAAISHATKPIYATQFHPEVDLSEDGIQIFKNFLFKIAKFKGDYHMTCRRQLAIDYIRNAAQDKKVLVLVSGGVDSTVCATLLTSALGKERVYALHVDTGFMRHKESQTVCEALKKLGVENLKLEDATEVFQNARTKIDGKDSPPLKDCLNPETKRKIIGDTFMKVAEEGVKTWELKFDEMLLAQGTLRPDLIESASKIASSNATVIKTHHNDTEMVRALRDSGRVIEPLRDYHKDEVRQLGVQLGLPEEFVWRQPFPGPGLAIRVICTDKPEISADADKIVKQFGDFKEEKNVFMTLLPCRTVGVQGDGRSYSSLVTLTCEGEPDWKQLMSLAKQIPQKIHEVNRVVFTFGAPIKEKQLNEITVTTLNTECITQLQAADHIVNQILEKYKLNRKLSQVPVILFPVSFGEEGKRGIAIRPFVTNDFMTGVPAFPGSEFMPSEALEEIVSRVLKEVKGIARVSYDLTSKPPATTEWE